MKKENRFNKTEYDTQYIRENITRVSVVLSKKYDSDIIEALQDKPSKSEYIKKLIREDLQKES